MNVSNSYKLEIQEAKEVDKLPKKFTPSPGDEARERRISRLINGYFINTQEVDKAYEIAKKMDSSTCLHFMLSDICKAYLKLWTIDGCQKAYEVAKDKQEQRANIRRLLDEIIERCLEIKTAESVALAEDIYEENAKTLTCSLHKNAFHSAMAQLGDSIEKARKEKSKSRPITKLVVRPVNVERKIHEPKKVEEKTLQETQKEERNFLFEALRLDQLEKIEIELSQLDPLQKSKLFSSRMKVVSSWVGEEEEMTPLQYACFRGNKKAVELFITQGASVNDMGDTSLSTQRAAIHFAIDANHPDIALLLLEKGAEDPRPASCKKYHGKKEYQLPLEFGSSIHTCLTALHMAIIKYMPEVVEKLLKDGKAEIKEKASGINTCMHLAARTGSEDMVKMLLSYGGRAALQVKNSDGQTPQEIALEYNHGHLADLLR